MDLESRSRWIEYSQAKDHMFNYTDTKLSPWRVVIADDKKKARLNCIRDLLSMIAYEDIKYESITLPERQSDIGYARPPISNQTFIKDYYEE